MENEFSGKLVLVVGPSGSGKGTLVSRLKKEYPEFVYPASSTTREPRPGEEPGKTYNYITLEDFKKGIEEDAFLEWAFVHDSYYYGTAKEPILRGLEEGKTVVREIDMQGLKSILDSLPKENVLSIFIDAPDLETLMRRVKARAPLSEEELQERLESAREEIDQKHICNAVVMNREGELDETYENFKKALLTLIGK